MPIDDLTVTERDLARAFLVYAADLPDAEGIRVFKKPPPARLAAEWDEPVIIVEAPDLPLLALSQHEARAVAAGILSVLLAPGDVAQYPAPPLSS